MTKINIQPSTPLHSYTLSSEPQTRLIGLINENAKKYPKFKDLQKVLSDNDEFIGYIKKQAKQLIAESATLSPLKQQKLEQKIAKELPKHVIEQSLRIINLKKQMEKTNAQILKLNLAEDRDSHKQAFDFARLQTDQMNQQQHLSIDEKVRYIRANVISTYTTPLTFDLIELADELKIPLMQSQKEIRKKLEPELRERTVDTSIALQSAENDLRPMMLKKKLPLALQKSLDAVALDKISELNRKLNNDFGTIRNWTSEDITEDNIQIMQKMNKERKELQYWIDSLEANESQKFTSKNEGVFLLAQKIGDKCRSLHNDSHTEFDKKDDHFSIKFRSIKTLQDCAKLLEECSKYLGIYKKQTLKTRKEHVQKNSDMFVAISKLLTQAGKDPEIFLEQRNIRASWIHRDIEVV
jgi:hypothetical protein